MWTISLNVVGALAAAALALGLWRYQLIAKRRYEIAEQLATNATRVLGAMRWARSRGGYSTEGKTRPKAPGESEEETRHLNALYWPIERFAASDELFIELWRSQVLCEMHFGVEAGKPVATLRDIRDEIVREVQFRIDADGTLGQDALIKSGQIIHGDGNDETSKRIDIAFAEIERLVGTHLRPHWISLFLPWVSHARASRITAWWHDLWRRYRSAQR